MWQRLLVGVACTVLTVDAAVLGAHRTEGARRDQILQACAGALRAVDDLRSGKISKASFSINMRASARHADIAGTKKGAYRHVALQVSFGIEQLEAALVEAPTRAALTGPVANADVADFESLCRSV